MNITAAPGNDIVTGTTAADKITANNDGDTIYGDTAGPFLLTVGSFQFGFDTIIGGRGKDTIFGDAGGDFQASGGAAIYGGNDTISDGIGNDTIVGDSGGSIVAQWTSQVSVTIAEGGAPSAQATGTASVARGGDDTITAGNGNDIVYGDAAGSLGSATRVGSTVTITLAGATTAAYSVQVGQDSTAAATQTGTTANTAAIYQSADNFSASETATISQHGTDQVTQNSGTIVQQAGNASASVDQVGSNVYSIDQEIPAPLAPSILPAALAAFSQGVSGFVPTTGSSSTSLAVAASVSGATGAGGNDKITVGNGADTIYGDVGGDMSGTIVGYRVNGGAWQVLGAYSATGGNDTIYAGNGKDTIYGDAGGTLSANVNYVTPFGASDDLSAEIVVLPSAYGGNDEIHTGSGNDLVVGDAQAIVDGGIGGNDTFYTGKGTDILVGDAGTGGIVSHGFAPSIAGSDTIYAGTGKNTIYGDTSGDMTASNGGVVQGGNNEIHGGTGTNTIFGAAGGTISTDGSPGSTVIAGNNVIYGKGTDVIYGDALTIGSGGQGGNNIIFGGTGKEVIYASALTIAVGGHAGNDTIYAGNGGDTIYADAKFNLAGAAGAGNDTIWGGNGADTIYGGAGIDAISAGAGADKVILGSGTSTVDGGTGNDAMTAGGGLDTFVFSSGSGSDTVASFNTTNDQLSIHAYHFASFAALSSHIAASGSNTIIHLDSRDSVTLTGVSPGALTSHNFIL